MRRKRASTAASKQLPSNLGQQPPLPPTSTVGRVLFPTAMAPPYGQAHAGANGAGLPALYVVEASAGLRRSRVRALEGCLLLELEVAVDEVPRHGVDAPRVVPAAVVRPVAQDVAA